jgi:hypothetical protein
MPVFSLGEIMDRHNLAHRRTTRKSILQQSVSNDALGSDEHHFQGDPAKKRAARAALFRVIRLLAYGCGQALPAGDVFANADANV